MVLRDFDDVRPTDEQAVSILRRMLVMRRFEERVIELHAAREMTGVFHIYIGQEGTGAAVLEAISPEDYVLTTHRNHGHVVGRGADLGRTFAELMGRATGLLGGRGGGFHASDPSRGMLQTSGIVGGCVSLATGAAYGIQQAGADAVAVAFFGDAALEEGVAYESFALAQLWSLPVIFVCENNSVGVGELRGDSYPRSMLGSERLSRVPEMVGVKTLEISNGLNAGEVFAATVAARRHCVDGGGPVFIESPIMRYPGSQSLMPTSTGDTDLRLATSGSVDGGPYKEWKEQHDPLIRWAREVIAAGHLTPEEVLAMDEDVVREIDAAAKFAMDSPFPDPVTATERIFAAHEGHRTEVAR